MEQRETATLHLAPVLKSKLTSAGYRILADFKDIDTETLCRDCGIGAEDAESVLKIIEISRNVGAKHASAVEIRHNEDTVPTIMTFSEEVDTALGGGIEVGRVTEICGLPGTGKTQLCMQLSCDVQIPAVFGGLDAEAVYIDVDGGFVVDRVRDIVNSTVKHCHFMAAGENTNNIVEPLSKVTVDNMLGGVFVQKCSSSSQLLAMVNLLPEFLNSHTKVKLVIIDSVSFHFRHEFEDMSLRTRVLTYLAQTLIRLARHFNIAVVITNQMTTKLHRGHDKGSYLVPCLGESWGHAITTRIILQHERGTRRAWIYKSPHLKQVKACFQITADGIRDVTDGNWSPDNEKGDAERATVNVPSTASASNANEQIQQPSKRQRLDDYSF